MSEPTGKNGNGVKTLGIKLEPELHAQFSLVCQLDNVPLTTGVQRAVEHYVQAKRAEGDFTARANEALAEIEREAAARRGAIQALFGTTEGDTDASDTADTSDATPTSPSKGRSTRRNSSKK